MDSLARFVTEPTFFPNNDQEVADLVALLLSFSGSDLPKGSPTEFFLPPGPDSQDTHAAVGQQVTLGSTGSTPAQLGRVMLFMSLAEKGRVGLVVNGRQKGQSRGYAYVGKGTFQSDRASEKVNAYVLMARAREGSELTYTVVPAGTEWRIGVDHDENGLLDRDEEDRVVRAELSSDDVAELAVSTMDATR